MVDVFSAANFGGIVEIILRPGCYVTYDIRAYYSTQAGIMERNHIAHGMSSSLLPAYVQSVPEPEKAIIAMGKRDAVFDSDQPVPALHFRLGDHAPVLSPNAGLLQK